MNLLIHNMTYISRRNKNSIADFGVVGTQRLISAPGKFD
jgi:hypothetical protein